ncbi:MAG: ABC transporter ATP-binding protein [Actinobacteria bacterium]|nr:ABC transporter ATP-binding protein [Actinomycetota bacterium]
MGGDERREDAEAERVARRAGWRLMADTVRPQLNWLLGGIGAGIVWAGAKITVPLLAAAAIDQGIRYGDTRTTLIYVAIAAVVGVLQAVGTSARRYCAFLIALRTEADLRHRLFARLQQLHFAFHDKAQTGQLMARAVTDIQQIEPVVILVPLSVASVVQLIAVAVILFATNWILAVLALGALPLLNFAAQRFTRRIQPVTLHLQEELADLSGVVEETVAGVRVVKGFGAESMQNMKLADEAGSVLDRSLEAARLRAWFLALVDFLPMLSLVVILWYGGHLVLRGQMQVGQIVAFNFYILMLVWPMRMFGMLLAQASRASAAAGRIHEILVTEPEIRDRTGAGPLPEGPGELRFEHVQFGYGPGRHVLEDLDLVIRGGEAVALVGATGSGKSTIARLVPRFYDVDRGRVLLDGVDVRDVRVSDLRRNVGLVFEDTFLFSDTVRENISFADPKAPMPAVQRAAELAGAAGFIESLPDGYDTVVGEQGFSLSGGQRQRVAIARAVLAEPRVLILDDATSSVDPTKEHEIRAALREVMAGRTTLIIAHRPATVALADRVVLLDHGRVVAEGTHEELLSTCEAYRTVLAHAAAAPTGEPASASAGGNDLEATG